MRNTEKGRRSAAPNLLVQFPLAELTLQLAVDPSKSRRQKPTVDPGKSRRLIPTKLSPKVYCNTRVSNPYDYVDHVFKFVEIQNLNLNSKFSSSV
jgi:hypothetical protein